MSFKEFLVELRQLIQERAVISCIHPKLVALGAVNESPPSTMPIPA